MAAPVPLQWLRSPGEGWVDKRCPLLTHDMRDPCQEHNPTLFLDCSHGRTLPTRTYELSMESTSAADTQSGLLEN